MPLPFDYGIPREPAFSGWCNLLRCFGLSLKQRVNLVFGGKIFISTVVTACLADDVWASKLTAMLNHWYSKSTVTLGPDGDMNDVKAIGLVVFAAKNADFSLPQALVENLSALRISSDQLHPDMGLLPQDIRFGKRTLDPLMMDFFEILRCIPACVHSSPFLARSFDERELQKWQKVQNERMEFFLDGIDQWN